MKLSIKAKRNIGLVVVTLAIVVAIILVVYFVQKNDDDNKLQRGSIGQVVSTAQADICVKDRIQTQSQGDYTAEQGKCLLVLTVDIKANKKLALSSSKFEVANGKNLTADGSIVDKLSVGAIGGKVTLKKGESKTFQLVYEVKSEQIDSFYLTGYGAKIDLANTYIK